MTARSNAAATRPRPLADLSATRRLAAELASLARPGDVIALSGPLGVGKTEFARAFIRALARRHGAPEPAEVPSPTFTLVQTYDLGAAEVWHFDLYRLERPEDAAELGLDEALAGGVTLIEWPERLGGQLPRDRLDLALAYAGQDKPGARSAVLTGCGSWRARLGPGLGRV
ncbi:MAG: tRNA (adenosine(37)-N6)-threonylcarbamoyltransferase complex ATPase subunit type 1 TsaE [Rhodospirillales bacterium]